MRSHWWKSAGDISLGSWEGSAVALIFENLLDSGLGVGGAGAGPDGGPPEDAASAHRAVLVSQEVFISLTTSSKVSLLFSPSPRVRISSVRLAQELSSSVRRSMIPDTLALAVALAKSLKTPLGSGRANNLLISVRAGNEVPSLTRIEIFCLIVLVALLAAAMADSSPSGTMRFSGLTMMNGTESEGVDDECREDK